MVLDSPEKHGGGGGASAAEAEAAAGRRELLRPSQPGGRQERGRRGTGAADGVSGQEPPSEAVCCRSSSSVRWLG